MEFNGSKTEKNLWAAFAGESQARNKYTFFAQAAEKAGYMHIAKIFSETADNEKEHGKIWFQILMGDKLNSTLENLLNCAQAEHYEWSDMYKNFSQDAKEEGFEHIAFLFERIRQIEEMHETRYRKLIEDVRTDMVFRQDKNVIWECAKCGYTVDATEPPQICPFCSHPKAYYFIKCFNY